MEYWQKFKGSATVQHCGNNNIDSLPNETAASWVVPFRTSGKRPPIFCPCGGGGDVFIDYEDLALALPEDQPFYAFGVPPFEEGEPIPTVEKLASIYVSKVREIQKHGPYRLCGYSFGGLVAYEMALILAGQGEEIEIVALLDALHPTFSKNLSIKEQAKFQLTYLSNRLARYRQNLMLGRIDLIFHDASRFVFHNAKRIFWRNTRRVLTKLGRPIPNFVRSDKMILVSAWNLYHPRNSNGRVVLFTAADRPPEYDVDRSLGWKASAVGSFNIHVVPGDHHSMLHPPHVHVLVEQIMPYLRAVSLD